MQAWNRLPSRITPNKFDFLTSRHQFRVSREVTCGESSSKHGLTVLGRIHVDNPASPQQQQQPRMMTSGANCLMPGGDNAAATAAALSVPQAELCAANAECVTVDELGSVDGLAKWLADRMSAEKPGIDSWGVDSQTKCVANLWTELMDGEISLEDSIPPRRTVHVASVKVRNEVGMFLIESHQEMDDGRRRSRNRPLSEKMRPGENVENACRRGLYEELGPEMGARDRVEMILETYRREEQERDSFSYPGLLTRYVLHSMVASVRGLPTSDFCTVENEGHPGNGSTVSNGATNGAANGAVAASAANRAATTNGSSKVSHNGHALGVRKHFWKWVTDAELDAIMKSK